MAAPSDRDELQYYLSAVRRAPELDREREAELVRRSRDGDEKATAELVRGHQRLVVVLAIKYRRSGVSLGELVAEGNLGLLHALRKFEPERGVRYATYAAYWIRAEMMALLVRANRIVGGSDGPMRSQMYFRLRRERARVFNQWGSGELADEELASRLGVTVARLQALNARLDARDVPLEAPDHRGEGVTFEYLAAPQDQERELCERQLGTHLRSAVGRALACLDPRERQIIELRQMAEPDQEVTLADLARRLGISRERARQLEARALSKLRRAISSSADHVVREWIDSEVVTTAA